MLLVILNSSWCIKYIDLHDVFLFFTAVDCGNLNDPANGQVNHTAGTTFRQTATYSCSTGYNLVGDSIRTCQAEGEWSGSAPTCLGTFVINPFPPSDSVRHHDHTLSFALSSLKVAVYKKGLGVLVTAFMARTYANSLCSGALRTGSSCFACAA